MKTVDPMITTGIARRYWSYLVALFTAGAILITTVKAQDGRRGGFERNNSRPSISPGAAVRGNFPQRNPSFDNRRESIQRTPSRDFNNSNRNPAAPPQQSFNNNRNNDRVNNNFTMRDFNRDRSVNPAVASRNFNRDRSFNRPGNPGFDNNRTPGFTRNPGYTNRPITPAYNRPTFATLNRPAYRPNYGFNRRPIYNAYDPCWRYGYLPRRNSYFYTLPSSYFSISFGGIGYRYWDGVFYRPYNNLFTVIAPPVGIFINTLPVGYRTIYVHDYPYYYYNGTYYDRKGSDYYVVSPPVGAVVESLPAGYETVVIDGETYYTADGAQYKPVVQENGEIWYEVIKANS